MKKTEANILRENEIILSCRNSMSEFTIFRDNSYRFFLIYCFLSHFENETLLNTVELQWLEDLWNHENMFETGVVRANEG